MGSSDSKPVDLQTSFESELMKPNRDLNEPIRITGFGKKPDIDEAVLHQQLKRFVYNCGIYIDTCTIRQADYAALREEVLRTACLPCDVWFYKPPYDWIAEIRVRKAYVMQHKEYTLGSLIQKNTPIPITPTVYSTNK